MNGQGDNNRQPDGSKKSDKLSSEDDKDTGAIDYYDSDKEKSGSGLILGEKQSNYMNTNQTRTSKHAIPSNNQLTKGKIKYTGDKVIKAALKNLSSNASGVPEELLEKVALVLDQSNGYSSEELAEKIDWATDKVKSASHLRSRLKAVSNNRFDEFTGRHLGDHEIQPYDFYKYFNGYGTGDDNHVKRIDFKRFWEPIDRELTEFIVLPVGVDQNKDSPDDVNANQETQEGNQENAQVNVTNQEAEGNDQAIEVPEDNTDDSQAPELATNISDKSSVLVTGVNHSVYFSGGQLAVLDISQNQQLIRILNARNIPVKAVMHLINFVVGYVPVCHYRISELLSSMIDVIDSTRRVLAVGEIIQNLCAFIVHIIRMSPFIDEIEQAVLSSAYTGDLVEILEMQLINLLRLLNGNDIQEVAVNCISVQDTDVDDVMPEYFCSAVATCMDNKTEVLELFGCRCLMCEVLMCQRKYIVKEILNNPRCCSLLNDELWSRLAALVDAVNSQSNCCFSSIQINLPFETLQRNLIHGLQNLQNICIPDNLNLRRVLHFIINESFINWKLSQSIADQQMPIGGLDMPPSTSEHAEILNCVRDLQCYIDRLCNLFINPLCNDLYQSLISMLQPFVLGALVSKRISSFKKSVRKCFSRLQHYLYSLIHCYSSILPIALTPKISISVTATAGDISIYLKQLNEFLENCLASRYQDCYITRLLRLPPASIINSEPMMIVVNLTFTFPSTLLLNLGFMVNPVAAVDLHNRESLAMVIGPTNIFCDDESSQNSIVESDVSCSDSMEIANDYDKIGGYLNIHGHFLAENGPYEYFPPNDFVHSDFPNENEVNFIISVEATLSHDSSDPDSQV